jgi:hypothetical protein
MNNNRVKWRIIMGGLLISIIILFIIPLTFPSEWQPTIREALEARVGNDANEIIFVYEDDKGATAFHPGFGWSVSQHKKIYENDEVSFKSISTSTGGAYILFRDFFKTIDDSKISINANLRNNETIYNSIGRRPLWGLSHDPIIHNLRINGIKVDYVIEYIDVNDETVFFWFFRDFPKFEGTIDDITITFDE